MASCYGNIWINLLAVQDDIKSEDEACEHAFGWAFYFQLLVHKHLPLHWCISKFIKVAQRGILDSAWRPDFPSLKKYDQLQLDAVQRSSVLWWVSLPCQSSESRMSLELNMQAAASPVSAVQPAPAETTAAPSPAPTTADATVSAPPSSTPPSSTPVEGTPAWVLLFKSYQNTVFDHCPRVASLYLGWQIHLRLTIQQQTHNTTILKSK